MAGNDDAWKALKEPASSSRADLLAYFGIPPSPEESLTENARLKRRYWARFKKPPGDVVAARVRETIQQVTEALIKGTPLPEVEAAAPVEEPPIQATLVPVDDLLDHLDGLLLGGNLQGALEVALKGREAYPTSWVPYYAHARVIQLAWESQVLRDPRQLTAGVEAARWALDQRRDDPQVWATTAALVSATGDYAALDSLVQDAGRQLDEVPQDMLVSLASGLLARGDLDQGLPAAVRAVAADPANRSARGDLAVAVVRAAAAVLPISSDAAMSTYGDAVAVAAWCADGVPEAEAVVRPHRVWATRARSRVFVGNDVFRTAVATYSAFLLLPLHNLVSAQPAWKVLWNGPNGRGGKLLWTIWSFDPADPYAWRDSYVQELHREVLGRLPWMGQVAA